MELVVCNLHNDVSSVSVCTVLNEWRRWKWAWSSFI